MKLEELVGKAVKNLEKEKGVITSIDNEGRIVVQYGERTCYYIKDALDRGFITIDDPVYQQHLKIEKVQKQMKALSHNLKEYISELNSLVGLDNIKERVQDLICEIKIASLRDAFGLKCPEVSKHLVFIGNPGTGKTTVARIIAKIYKTLGVLSKGHFIEADRSTLVAGYQGQTAIKTKEVISKAIGGILFVDEAYSLCHDKDDDFGYEALDTLVKEMEDHRDDFMVIVAGYKDEMAKFLAANPGLASRFKTVINFDDYSSDELYLILKNLLKSNDYVLTKEADKMVQDYFKKEKSFSGNGRTVRNYFEEIIRYQSRRLNTLEDVDANLLVTIEASDLVGMGLTC